MPETVSRPDIAAKSVDLSAVVRASIHPALGVARIGNSATEYFIGPEVESPSVQAPGFYRGANGALKRQAARFRIYGYDAQGNVVAELTGANSQIDWAVHLSNQKAAWYEFQQALDIPESKCTSSPRRNAGVTGPARAGLVIDGGIVAITGENAAGPGFAFNGTFLGTQVYLGELRTDDEGRLVVLGGYGISASPTNTPLSGNFANNDGWYDDTSDGPVTATVVVAGQSIQVDPAWVIVAPPNYAPNLKSVRTMYDLVSDLFGLAGSSVSFTQDILPIFKRMSELQWANFGFAKTFGYGASLDFGSPEFLSKAAAPLAFPGDPSAEWRVQVANSFRDYDRDSHSPIPLPWLYGDAPSKGTPSTPNYNSALSPTQLRDLHLWALGEFNSDYDPSVPPPGSIGEVPLAQQPAMLDRAALDFCLADAFHPGCEITWPMRHTSMYMAAFRILHADPGAAQPDYGDVLTPSIALAPNGPLCEQWPGGLTRWMAIPWQTDTASCLSGYNPQYDPYLPTFWPARVPNQVLDEPDYLIVVDPTQPRERRIAAFNTRPSWPGVLPGNTHEQQVDAMVYLFPAMGIVEKRPGVPDDPDFPPVMQVAKLPDFEPWEPGPVIPPINAAVAFKVRTHGPRGARPMRHAPSVDGTYMGRFPKKRRDPADS